MGMTGFPRNPRGWKLNVRGSRGDGSKCCGTPAGIEKNLTGFPRELKWILLRSFYVAKTSQTVIFRWHCYKRRIKHKVHYVMWEIFFPIFTYSTFCSCLRVEPHVVNMSDKSEVQKLVNLKSDRVTFQVNEGKSDVWKLCQLVPIDGASVPFVKCNKCHTVLRWKSRDGTNGLRSHFDFCASKSHSQQTLASLPGFLVGPKVPAGVKSDVADAIVTMCAKDLRLVMAFVLALFYKSLVYIRRNKGLCTDTSFQLNLFCWISIISQVAELNYTVIIFFLWSLMIKCFGI